MNVQILVIKPGTMSDDDKQTIRASGDIVIVETDDENAVRLLTPEPFPASSNAMLYSAMQAIVGPNGDTHVRAAFTRHLAGFIKEPQP